LVFFPRCVQVFSVFSSSLLTFDPAYCPVSRFSTNKRLLTASSLPAFFGPLLPLDAKVPLQGASFPHFPLLRTPSPSKVHAFLPFDHDPPAPAPFYSLRLLNLSPSFIFFFPPNYSSPPKLPFQSLRQAPANSASRVPLYFFALGFEFAWILAPARAPHRPFGYSFYTLAVKVSPRDDPPTVLDFSTPIPSRALPQKLFPWSVICVPPSPFLSSF